VLIGAQVSMTVGVLTAALSTVISVLIGMLAGYFGGRTDMVTQRVVDAWMIFPDIVLLIVVISILGPGMLQIVGVLGLLYGIGGSRIIRGAVMSVRENTYTRAAQAIGASPLHILWRHILPNIGPVVILLFTSRIGAVILAEAGLSFLGLGVPPPAATWGEMLTGSGRSYMYVAPWLALGPRRLPHAGGVLHQRVWRRPARRPRPPDAGRLMRILAALVAAVTLFGCGPPRLQTTPPPSPADKPQYGGELNVGTAHVTLSALSWDPADWTWKSNHDTGNVREQLFAADLSKAASRGGPYPYTLDAYVPEDALRGELAERWEWEGPLTLVVHLRRGVMWPDKPGVMKARELDAHDVVYTYRYVDSSPKKIANYFEHLDRVEARDSHTVVFHLKTYSVEWAYRFGYGYYSGIVPREAAKIDQRDWKNVVGTAPSGSTATSRAASRASPRTPTIGTARRSAGRRAGYPSWTASPTGSSRTRRRTSPPCAPASSTSLRR
jgi:hypothetical protein